jgi:hypothetical protein
MKTFLFLLISVCSSLGSNAQNKYTGEWHDYEASDMTLNPDQTFHFLYRFDLIVCWVNGTWIVQKNTLYFTWIPVYDTVSLFDPMTNTMKDSLFLSETQKPTRWSQIPVEAQLTPAQNKYFLPKKLYYHRNVLNSFNVETGKMLTKRFKPLFGSKKKPAGYHRNVRPGRDYISVDRSLFYKTMS